jgi:hypothetical protein
MNKGEDEAKTKSKNSLTIMWQRSGADKLHKPRIYKLLDMENEAPKDCG